MRSDNPGLGGMRDVVFPLSLMNQVCCFQFLDVVLAKDSIFRSIIQTLIKVDK